MREREQGKQKKQWERVNIKWELKKAGESGRMRERELVWVRKSKCETGREQVWERKSKGVSEREGGDAKCMCERETDRECVIERERENEQSER